MLPAAWSASRRSTRRWMAALAIVAVVSAGSHVLRTSALFVHIPPVGSVWFGKTFDHETYEVRSPLLTIGSEEHFVMVARLPRPLAGPRLVIRAYLDGELQSIAWTASRDDKAVWGFDMWPIPTPGTWRYDIAEMGGGEALASGQFVITKVPTLEWPRG